MMSMRTLDYQQLGERIQKVRKGCGYTQESLARSIGRPIQYVSLLESGKVVPDLGVLLALCDEFHVLPEYLLFDQDTLSRKVFEKMATSHLTQYEDEALELINGACERIMCNRRAD